VNHATRCERAQPMLIAPTAPQGAHVFAKPAIRCARGSGVGVRNRAAPELGAAAAQAARCRSAAVSAVPGRDEDRGCDHRPGCRRCDPTPRRRGWRPRPARTRCAADCLTGALPDPRTRFHDARRAVRAAVCPQGARGTRKRGRHAQPDPAARRPEGVRSSRGGFGRSADAHLTRRYPRAGDPGCSQEVRADTTTSPLLASLRASVVEYVQGREQEDDQTAILIKRST